MKDVYCTTSLWADDSMLHTLDYKIILQSHRYPAEQNKHLALPHMVLGPLWAHETFCKLINKPPLRTTPRSLMRPSRQKPSENSQYMTLRSYYVYPRVGLRSVFFLILLFGGKKQETYLWRFERPEKELPHNNPEKTSPTLSIQNSHYEGNWLICWNLKGK